MFDLQQQWKVCEAHEVRNYFEVTFKLLFISSNLLFEFEKFSFYNTLCDSWRIHNSYPRGFAIPIVHNHLILFPPPKGITSILDTVTDFLSMKPHMDQVEISIFSKIMSSSAQLKLWTEPTKIGTFKKNKVFQKIKIFKKNF